MKHIRKFENESSYNAYLETDNAVSPNVSLYYNNSSKILNYRKKQNIPLKYKPIEYIKSNGKQFIYLSDIWGDYDPNVDRGFFDAGSQYRFKIKYMGETSNGQEYQAALYSIGNDYGPTLYNNNTLGVYWKFPLNSIAYFKSINPAHSSLSNRQIKISNYGELKEADITYECIATSDEFKPWTPVLFARPDTSTSDPDRIERAELYYFKMYKDNDLIIDCVPCIYNNVPGLYEKINDVFLPSSNVGYDFEAGPMI